jgi:hypothetical protein
MAMATGTPDFGRNGDDLRDLRDEIQEDINLRMTMIRNEVTESSNEITRSLEGRRAQVSTETLKMILDKIQLAEKEAMVS